MDDMARRFDPDIDEAGRNTLETSDSASLPTTRPLNSRLSVSFTSTTPASLTT
jgi:hypothetical protein